MIFKSLFKPKWQHKDSTVRLQTIQTLEPDNDQEILESIYQQDSDNRVVLAALQRLNSAEHWIKALSLNNKKASQLAKQKLLASAQDKGEFVLSKQQTRELVSAFSDKQSRETLLNCNIDFELKYQIVNQLNKPHLLIQLLSEQTDASNQDQILQQIDDESTLLKVLKKNIAQGLQEKISSKLEAIKLNKEKPAQIEKQTRLALAKLNALKEELNLDIQQQQRELLQREWVNLESEFNCLAKETREQLSQKYKNLNQQLDSKKRAAQQAWDDSQKEIRLQQQTAEQLVQVENLIDATSEQVLKLAEQGNETLAEEDSLKFSQQLAQITQLLESLEKTDNKIEELYRRLTRVKNNIASLPQVLTNIALLKELLQQLSEAEVAENRSQLEEKQQWYNSWKEQWQSHVDSLGFSLPTELSEQFEQYSKYWHQSFSELRQQVKKDFNYAQHKLTRVGQLVDEGKFNAAIGLFNKVVEVYQCLPEKSQLGLSRKYQSISEQIEKLNSLKESIAGPKKQELLDAILILVEQPLTSVPEQAQQVKTLRANWNSLGVSDIESDKAINAAFDEACEQAFAPCRLYYAEQEKQRANNYEQKQQLLLQFKELVPESGQPLNNEQLSLFNQLQIQWQRIGEVEKAVYKELASEYKQCISNLKLAADISYSDNQRAKEKLIAKAESLIGQEDIRSATNESKELQKQWKQVGFAGKKEDSKLWKRFRAVNDQLFARLSDTNQEIALVQKENLEKAEEVLQKLAAVEHSSDIDVIRSTLDASRQSLEQYENLSTKSRNSIQQQFKQIKANLLGQISTLEQQKHQQEYQFLFELLESKEPESTIEQSAIKNKWKEMLQLVPNELNQRHILTIKLELVAGRETPSIDHSLRQQVQIEMLANKMQQGQTTNKESLLESWLSQGPLTSDDYQLVSRIKPIFI